MTGLTFADMIISLRKAKNIGSTELSLNIGMAQSYISQIERGKTKSVKYEQAKVILEGIGVEEDSIPMLLRRVGIYSDNDNDDLLKARVAMYCEVYESTNDYLAWTNNEEGIAMQLNYSITEKFKVMANRDINRAIKVLENIEAMTRNKSTFDFFCDMNMYKYADMSDEKRNQILAAIKKCLE